MKRLLIIAHAPSDNTQKMHQAVISGASDSRIENVEVVSLSPLETQPEHINSAHAIILGTTENLGYMAGLMKDVFDRCYYPCLEKNEGLPFAFYVRAGHDGTGTRRAIEGITTGMRWRLVQDPLICKGDFQAAFLDQCEELGMSMAASLEAGII
ncbi:flavodoxin family protein [Halomonas sp. GFAJ-1]|uniref:flavodoxin family protein n=1 Tax=Halomonas sp. GFAJ-1 TaxID=1118153 RepID=UPI00023A24EA|nr:MULTISPECIES: flavodoxin family protein [unclassified Halomonas]AVI63849.1 flavodoxin [Halomonas sp. GFAJ-1]EHK60476.1 multimeric flavodoxin WrbA [Halomonas sp. GFAJ-1]MDP3534091.1 flavodoxin family protein [Halomonas sp.]